MLDVPFTRQTPNKTLFSICSGSPQSRMPRSRLHTDVDIPLLVGPFVFWCFFINQIAPLNWKCRLALLPQCHRHYELLAESLSPLVRHDVYLNAVSWCMWNKCVNTNCQFWTTCLYTLEGTLMMWVKRVQQTGLHKCNFMQVVHCHVMH